MERTGREWLRWWLHRLPRWALGAAALAALLDFVILAPGSLESFAIIAATGFACGQAAGLFTLLWHLARRRGSGRDAPARGPWRTIARSAVQKPGLRPSRPERSWEIEYVPLQGTPVTFRWWMRDVLGSAIAAVLLALLFELVLFGEGRIERVPLIAGIAFAIGQAITLALLVWHNVRRFHMMAVPAIAACSIAPAVAAASHAWL